MDNSLRAIRFQKPDYIPMHFAINGACWHHYPKEALWDLMEEHKHLFPGFTRPAADWEPNYGMDRKGIPYVDDMGCVWETADDGIRGTVIKHPLEDWSAFGTTWKMADSDHSDGLFPMDWKSAEAHWAQIREQGGTIGGGLRHGHTFLQLCDLRGYENLTFDMADEEPLLDELIEQLTDFNLTLVNRFINSGCCASMSYPEDLGMQVGPMLSPAHFRRYIKPAYQKLMKPARDLGIPIHMHSDGDIRDLVDDIIDSGVEIINLQDLVNGIDWIADRFRGKVCVDLDIDRQIITPLRNPRPDRRPHPRGSGEDRHPRGRTDHDLRPLPRGSPGKCQGFDGRHGEVFVLLFVMKTRQSTASRQTDIRCFGRTE